MASGCSIPVDTKEECDSVKDYALHGKLGGGSKTNLYIRGLSPNTTDKYLVNLCQGFGTITSTKAIIDQTTNKCKGYGFVNFDAPGAAERATQALQAQGIQAQMAKITTEKHGKYDVDLQEITTEKHDTYDVDLQEIPTEKHDNYDVDLQKIPTEKHDNYDVDLQKIPTEKHDNYDVDLQKIRTERHDNYDVDLQEIPTEKHDNYDVDLQKIPTEKHDNYDVDLQEEVMKGTIIAFHRQNHDHYGIYVGDGQMIHYIQDKRSMGTSDAGVKEENLEGVAKRKHYHECKTLDERFEALPAQQIVDRAKAELSNPKSKFRFKDSKSFAIWCRYDKVDAVPLLVPALCALGVGVFAGAVAREVKGPEELPNLIYPISAGLSICLGSAIALFDNFSFDIKLP